MARTKYFNENKEITPKPWRDLRKWQKERRAKKKDLSFSIPHAENKDFSFLQTNRSISNLVWVGHSTFLLQINGLNILTDPIWTKYLSYFHRLSEPGIPLEELPPIDVVVISHGHYDHLHFSTLKKLQGNPLYLVPIGLKKLFTKKKFSNVMECKWGETVEKAGVSFTFVPSQHWTRRGLFDKNTSHWGGWIMQTPYGPSIYFAGDSGYYDGFERLGNQYQIDFALLPIGAYEPEWFMKEEHMCPEEAVQAFVDCQATTMIPMHYGAYYLADDTPKEALNQLKNEWERRKLPSTNLTILKLGEILYLTKKEN